MKTATLVYLVKDFGREYIIVFDINKETLKGFMTIFDYNGNVESRTEYYLSDDDEWRDLEHEIGQLELDIFFGNVKRLR